MNPASDPRTLRVLVVHNRYQQRGGEDTVVEAEAALLRSHGHAVQEYLRSNDDIDTLPRAQAAIQTFWSRRTLSEVGALVSAFRPDLVHVHNTFPLVSPSVYYAAGRAGLPVVQTLHNFRLVCPQGMLLRDEKPCEDCVGRLPWRAVVHRCYRDSSAQSSVLAAMLATHRAAGTWSRRITRYIALNEFCRERFIAGGLPADKIRVKPNFVDLPAPAEQTRSGLLFVGRLSHEKGVAVLAEAMRRSSDADLPQLRVVGTGPQGAVFEGIAGVRCVGMLAGDEVAAEMSRAAALIVPSIWYENYPRSIVEAFACGLPVIASRIGALPTLVEHERTGLLFAPGDADDLVRTLRWAHRHPAAMAHMGAQARRHYEQHLTGSVNHAQLLDIYADALRDRL